MLIKAILDGKVVYLPLPPDSLILDSYRFVLPQRASTVCLLSKASVTTDGGLTFENTKYATVVEIDEGDSPDSIIESRPTPVMPDMGCIAMVGNRITFIKVRGSTE